ncbi:MAG: Flp pilus assembly complex ATPase component TadA [Syntrophorhabdus sp.]|nr:Flp pilus assembly complex ATPase component TadA [Syntrophorhabdus sp.]
MERKGEDATLNMTAGNGGINVNVAELNIENLGWFRDVLVYAKERNATDIIVVEKRPVRLGILKKCEVMEIGEGIVVKPGKTEILAAIAETRQRKFDEETDTDAGTAIIKHIRNKGYFEYAFSVKDIGRFRMSVSSSQEGLGFAARVLPYTIPGLEELDPFNMLAGIRGLFDFSYSYPRGLILHTGVVGSGKTTLIASELDYLAERMNGAVYTLEDPIEYVYQNKRTVFRQYEIGTHIPGILEGVRMSLRNNLAGLVVGEVRTREEVTALFTAAEKGFLVISSIHTPDAMTTLRLLDGYGDDRDAWRKKMAQCLTAIVSQKLIHKEYTVNGSKKTGYILVPEVLFFPATIRAGIERGAYNEVENAFRGNAIKNAVTFEMSLSVLEQKGVIDSYLKMELLDRVDQGQI